MANWTYVENNAIIEQHDLLPKNWKHISGLNLSADDLPFLKSLGWYPVTKQQTNYDDTTQYISGYDYVVRQDDVLETEIISTKELVNSNILQLKNNFYFQLRMERDKKLQQSDWTQLPDIQNTLNSDQKNKWLLYRQKLRDITKDYLGNEFVNINQVVWPYLPQ